VKFKRRRPSWLKRLQSTGLFLSSHSLLTGIPGQAGNDLRHNIVSPPLQDELPDLTDADAVRLAQQGDAVAFKRNYRLHSRKVHKLRPGIARARAAAEDLTQIYQDSYEVPDLQFEGSLSGLASWAWAR
jgi:hypothetical protein